MLISHFTTLQNKDLSGFVSVRKAKADKTDPESVLPAGQFGESQ